MSTDDLREKGSMADTLRVGIVGAGIGGLAAAIALRRAGAKVTVLEAAEELGEVGNLADCARPLLLYG
jgi:cation diffusion facilitator CzcD-associated flavoprotein CzcO